MVQLVCAIDIDAAGSAGVGYRGGAAICVFIGIKSLCCTVGSYLSPASSAAALCRGSNWGRAASRCGRDLERKLETLPASRWRSSMDVLIRMQKQVRVRVGAPNFLAAALAFAERARTPIAAPHVFGTLH